MQSVRTPAENISRSLKKLSLNSPSVKESQALPRKLKVTQSLTKLDKPTYLQEIEDQNTVSKLSIQNDLLRNRLKVLSVEMDQII